MNKDNNYPILKYETDAEILNNRTYTDIYYRLMLIAKCIFKWDGLPKGMDEKWIERYLYSEGRCMFFKDEKLGYMVTGCVDSGSYNVYDEPTMLEPRATGYTGKTRENNEDCILIRNNDEMLPTYPTIQLFANRLTSIERAIDVNINAQKTPVLILGSEKQKNTLKLVYKKWNGNEPVIFGDKNIDTSQMKTLNTQAPIVFDKLQIQKHSVWNDVMTFMGINNANMDKRERLVDDEVQANNEQIEMSAQVMLKSRKKACELINKMFPDLNVSVCLRKLSEDEISQIMNDKKPEEQKPSKEGEINE